MSLRSRWSCVALLTILSACTSTSTARNEPSSPPTGGATSTSAPGQPDAHWIRTWGASQQTAEPPFSQATPERVEQQTLRQTVHITRGGSKFRVQFSNLFGTLPLRIGGARLAIAASASESVADSERVLKFDGKSTAVLAPGDAKLSDEVPLRMEDDSSLVVTMYLPDSTPASTFHALSSQTTWVSPIGNFLDRAMPNTSTPTQSWFFLSAVDVLAPVSTRAIVALGDSITDGYQSSVNTNNRWPDRLGTRLRSNPMLADRFSVVNAGISGNRMRFDTIGPKALSRLDRDALAVPGVKYVVLLAGINDIGLPGTFGRPNEAPTAQDIIASYTSLIERTHARGVKVIGGTLTPFQGATTPGYYSKNGEAIRSAVNAWIRNSGAFDGFVDFDAAVRDPSNPSRLLAKYDSGDHLHPNDAGYASLANAVDLAVFK